MLYISRTTSVYRLFTEIAPAVSQNGGDFSAFFRTSTGHENSRI